MFKSKTQERIAKNMRYIASMNELALRSDIAFRSRIILSVDAVEAGNAGTYQI